MSKARGLADLGNVYDDGALSNRNLIINGAMQVAQRGDVTGINSIGPNYGGPDRFAIYSNSPSSSAVFSAIQQSTGLAEFPECFRLDCTTAASGSLTGTHEIKIEHKIEAHNVQGVAFGTSSAKKLTLSFWCRSNKAATYALWFLRPDTSNRQTGVTYTISSANTWEYKTVTINADTTNTVDNDNGVGLDVAWIMNTGSDYTSGTAANGTWEALTDANRYVGHTATIGTSTDDYFDLTGVQLEVGDTATPFEHRSYGDELARCKRYFRIFGHGAIGIWTNANNARVASDFDVEMRTNPSSVLVTSTPVIEVWSLVALTGSASSIVESITSKNQANIVVNGFSGRTYGDPAYSPYDIIHLDAEL